MKGNHWTRCEEYQNEIVIFHSDHDTSCFVCSYHRTTKPQKFSEAQRNGESHHVLSGKCSKFSEYCVSQRWWTIQNQVMLTRLIPSYLPVLSCAKLCNFVETGRKSTQFHLCNNSHQRRTPMICKIMLKYQNVGILGCVLFDVRTTTLRWEMF